VNPENLESAKTQYQAGTVAFERGDYRSSVQYLEKASALLGRNSSLSGEVQILLVTAYDANEQRVEALALCEQLKRHPDAETSKQARQLLYILQAPRLKRPQKWLTQIPDLGTLEGNDPKMRYVNSPTQTKSRPRKQPQPEPIDLSQVNTRDNRFIWVALFAIAFIFGGLIWFN
jgi:tetratricopeptide (TPR) repeat protein